MEVLESVFPYFKEINVPTLSKLDYEGIVLRDNVIYLLLKHASDEAQKRGCIVSSFQVTYLRDLKASIGWNEIEGYQKTILLGKNDQ